MPETEALKRGPGRPRLTPATGPRRNVTFQVGMDLYGSISERAEKSGRSLSREIEFGLGQFYGESADALAQQALADAAERKAHEEIEREFGSRLTFFACRLLADAINAEMRKAVADNETVVPLFKDKDRSAALAQAIASHVPGVVASLSGMAVFADTMKTLNLGAIVSDLRTADPDNFRSLETRLRRPSATASN